jgi:hypothetical protein
MLRGFLIRDGSIVGVALVLWWLVAPLSAQSGWVADLSAWVTGLLLAACAYLAHEWSHYLGAVATGSKVPLGSQLSSVFLFSFDSEENSLLQFVAMSISGFAATAIAVWLFYTALPDAYLASRVARGGVVFLALLGIVLELPLLLYGIVTGGVPKQVSV